MPSQLASRHLSRAPRRAINDATMFARARRWSAVAGVALLVMAAVPLPAAASPAPVAGSAIPLAAGELGGRVFATGDPVELRILPATAGYTSEIWLFGPDGRFIGTNREVGKVIALGSFPAGAELVFGIFVRNTGRTFKTGPGERNPDGIPHGRVEQLAPGHIRVGFEDLFGGGDRDYDDVQFELRGGVDRVAEPAVRRAFLFVHGIKGDFTERPFEALMKPLRERYGDEFVRYFEYHQDAGHRLPDRRCEPERPLTEVLPYDDRVGYPVSFPVIGERAHCDSNDDVGVNGLFLEKDIARLVRTLEVEKVMLIANSMGAAIVRAYLAYASATRASRPPGEDTLALVDGVLFLQGVQQGSYLLNLRSFFDEDPIAHRVRGPVARAVRDLVEIDPDRPAAADLTPESEMVRYVNRLEHIPRELHYLNVRSDIQLRPAVLAVGYRFPTTVGVGDYLLLPGDQNPTRTPTDGGAGILPSVVAAGRSSGQWTLRSEQTVFYEIAVAQIPALIATQPESHLALGGKMGELCVATRRGVQRLDRALFDALTALDRRRPDLELLEFGNLATARCP